MIETLFEKIFFENASVHFQHKKTGMNEIIELHTGSINKFIIIFFKINPNFITESDYFQETDNEK